MAQTWTEAPTKGQIKARIDAFLRAFHSGDLKGAFEHCPPVKFVKGEGMRLETGLAEPELAKRVAETMFQFIEGQSVVEDDLATAKADEPATWCKLVTPPADYDYDGLSFEFSSDSDEEYDDVPDDTVANDSGEVLANVRLKGESTDITGRYALLEKDGVWSLGFSNFDVM